MLTFTWRYTRNLMGTLGNHWGIYIYIYIYIFGVFTIYRSCWDICVSEPVKCSIPTERDCDVQNIWETDPGGLVLSDHVANLEGIKTHRVVVFGIGVSLQFYTAILCSAFGLDSVKLTKGRSMVSPIVFLFVWWYSFSTWAHEHSGSAAGLVSEVPEPSLRLRQFHERGPLGGAGGWQVATEDPAAWREGHGFFVGNKKCKTQCVEAMIEKATTHQPFSYTHTYNQMCTHTHAHIYIYTQI